MATNCQLIGNGNSTKCQKSVYKNPDIESNLPRITMTLEDQRPIDDRSAKNDASSLVVGEERNIQAAFTGEEPASQAAAGDDVFESVFEASMADLEDENLDGYETDSESANEDNDADGVSTATLISSGGSGNLTCSSGLGCSVLATFPRSQSFEYENSSSSDDDQSQESFSGYSFLPNLFCSDTRGPELFRSRPYLLPFTERRRLSQCKEEDEEDGNGDKSPQPQGGDAVSPPKFEKANLPTPPPPPPPPPPVTPASAEKFKHLERLRQQFMHKIDSINTANIEDISCSSGSDAKYKTAPPPPPPIPPTILPKSLIHLLQSNKSGSVSTALASPSTPAKQKRREAPESRPPAVKKDQAAPASRSQAPSEPTPAKKIVRGKFIVTRALESAPQQQTLRTEAKRLEQLDASANAHTISFPSSFGGYSSVQGFFSQRYGSQKKVAAVPHLDKEFFDTSLVEIRSVGVSKTLPSRNKQEPQSSSLLQRSPSTGLRRHKSMKCDRVFGDSERRRSDKYLDEVWIKRPIDSEAATKEDSVCEESSLPPTAPPSEDEQDGRLPGSRPSSAPAEPNAKAARKASKKMEKEARRQEKEQRSREKEARKIERETARRLEREAAKLEKLTRNAEKISRSTERMAPRSGSLERRRSGEYSPVLNQSTVHGIASPNRRPTIFDVFRPRAKSEVKKQKEKLLDPLAAPTSAKTTDREASSSTSSTHSASGGGGSGGGGSGGGGGIMNTMKVAIQHTGLIGGYYNRPTVTVTAAESSASAKSKYKDGSAHPHQGSDAQYYHTVTAVRRADANRSPMTKVMDLFRHRSNSGTTEADKRKAVSKFQTRTCLAFSRTISP